jgi:hypothetical protein
MSVHAGAIVGTAAAAAPLEASMICMSVVEDGPRIAFASYNEEQNKILIEESYADGYETQGIAERVLATVRPTLLLVSNKIVTNDNLLEVLTTPPPNPREGSDEEEDAVEGNAGAQTANGNGNQSRARAIPYRLVKSSAFELRACKAMILKLKVRSLMKQANINGIIGHGGQQQRNFPLVPGGQQSFKISSYHALASIVNFDSNVQVQALGSLLSFLETTIFRLQEGGYITVNDVVHTKASLHMAVSSDTLAALNIFATEHHPLAVAKGYGNAKEGVSLFSLLDRTKSRSGRQRLREWMLKPLLDVNAISTRQDGVELFMLPDMQQSVSTLLQLLANAGAVDQILNRIQKCCTKANDFVVLIKTLNAAVTIVTTLQQEVLWKLRQRAGPQPLPQNQEGEQVETWPVDPMAPHYIDFVQGILQQCQLGCLEDLLERIVAVVDEEATVENRTVVVRAGYHEPLDLWKQQYHRLGDTLHETGEMLWQRLPYLRTCLTPLFMPQVSHTNSRIVRRGARV